MKKLFFLSVVFLLGMSRLSAQGAWEIKVNWNFDVNSQCEDQMLNYGYLVAITIIDEANNNDIVVYNVYNILPSGSYSTTFSSTQAGIEDYCSQQHDSPPSFKIFVDVQMRDPSGNQFCGQKSTNSSYTCSIISSGLELPTLTIY